MVLLEASSSDSSQTTAGWLRKKKKAIAQQELESSRSIAYFHRSELIVQRSRPLGEGYHGIVYEVEGIQFHKDDNSSSNNNNDSSRQHFAQHLRRDDGEFRYVLKHLHPRLLQQGKEAIQNSAMDLIAEATFLQQFQHENILPLIGLAQGVSTAFEGGNYDSFFLITERLSETLAQRIQRWRQPRQPLPPRSVQYSYGYQIAKALRYLHTRGVIYRDLKPSNIGFKHGDGTLQIFDFGLCRTLPSNNTTDQVFHMSGGVGTRRYCAVEVCQHRPYNAKADVYSWAMVFLEILTLDKPFADFSKEDHEKFVCEMGGSPNLSKYDLPDRIQSLLRNAWCRRIENRWTMAQVCEDLEWIMREEGKKGLEKIDVSAASNSDDVVQKQRRRSKVMDRKDLLVNREEECSSTLGYLVAWA